MDHALSTLFFKPLIVDGDSPLTLTDWDIVTTAVLATACHSAGQDNGTRPNPTAKMVLKTLTALYLLSVTMTATALPSAHQQGEVLLRRSSKKPWHAPTQSACSTSPLSEACLGTETFCHGEGLKTYGMAYLCLVDREGKDAPLQAKTPSLPWQEPNHDHCNFVLNEAYLGTQTFCNDDQARQCGGFTTAKECFEAHSPSPQAKKAQEGHKPAYGSLPWKKPDRAACAFIKNEACLGTEAFCRDEGTPEAEDEAFDHLAGFRT
ncbi:hypothetical protein CP533_2143 [Ophiocordyceps camponoti-saundersi (nom. inval.)]|nr:hypothetical protein CP533_2143 [Ophiocordyceps camponoti-saundersi (nom. inval.)]